MARTVEYNRPTDTGRRRRGRCVVVSAAILAGGRSRRMGRHKALLDFDGLTLLERTARTLEMLRPAVQEVFVVGEWPEYQALTLRIVPDDFPNAGPLGGLATALRAARSNRVLVVACDMPRLSERLLAAMLDAVGDEQVLVPLVRDTEGVPRYEALHAIYERGCLPSIEDRIRAGDLKATSFYPFVTVREVDEEWLRAHDPDLGSLTNVNTPEELANVIRNAVE